MKKILCLVIPLVILTCSAGFGDEAPALSKGQTLYAPVYSQVHIGNKEKPFLLTVTLMVRNVDPGNPITLTSVKYHDSNGRFLKSYLSKSVTLNPLSSSRYVIPRDEAEGGAGAGLLLTWTSQKPVNPPLVETVMIGTEYQQGISFTSRARVIRTE
jgi:hypothetical protein